MKKLNRGFTLVELIIVIAILAIIMLIAIPNFSGRRIAGAFAKCPLRFNRSGGNGTRCVPDGFVPFIR